MLGKELRDQVSKLRAQKAMEQRIEDEKLSIIKRCKDAASLGEDSVNLPILESFCPTLLAGGKLWDWLRSEGIGMTGWKTEHGSSYTLYW